MNCRQSPHPHELDEYLNILADHKRRMVIAYFQQTSDEVASIDNLLNYISDDDRRKEELLNSLAHLHLPKLEEAGLLEYDHRSKTVRYVGNESVERLLESIKY